MLAKFLDTKFNNQEEMENIQGQAMPYTRGLRGEGKRICLEMTMVTLESCYPNLQTSWSNKDGGLGIWHNRGKNQ